jgi:hypothetical protein
VQQQNPDPQNPDLHHQNLANLNHPDHHRSFASPVLLRLMMPQGELPALLRVRGLPEVPLRERLLLAQPLAAASLKLWLVESLLATVLAQRAVPTQAEVQLLAEALESVLPPEESETLALLHVSLF